MYKKTITQDENKNMTSFNAFGKLSVIKFETAISIIWGLTGGGISVALYSFLLTEQVDMDSLIKDIVFNGNLNFYEHTSLVFLTGFLIFGLLTFYISKRIIKKYAANKSLLIKRAREIVMEADLENKQTDVTNNCEITNDILDEIILEEV